MGTVDERPQVIGRSVQMRRCKKIYPVVTPAKFPGEIRDRHHFDHRDSDARQLRQLLRRGTPRSFLRECADVHFVNDLALQRNSRPLRVRPSELVWIDYARDTVRSFRLKARRRIGIKVSSAIYSKPVTTACADVDGAGKISTCFRC